MYDSRYTGRQKQNTTIELQELHSKSLLQTNTNKSRGRPT